MGKPNLATGWQENLVIFEGKVNLEICNAMTEYTTSAYSLKKSSGSILLPAAISLSSILLFFAHKDDIASYSGLVSLAVIAISLGSLAYGYISHVDAAQDALRVNERTLSVHTGGSSITFFWREVYSIDCERVFDGKLHIEVERVVLRIRRAGTREQDFERIVLDSSYGQTPENLCASLRASWNEATRASAEQSSTLAPRPVLAGNTPAPTFGRRSSDRAFR